MTLDWNRDYAMVLGGGVAHRFEQDGKKFDAQGEEIIPAASGRKVKTAAVVVAADAEDGFPELPATVNV